MKSLIASGIATVLLAANSLPVAASIPAQGTSLVAGSAETPQIEFARRGRGADDGAGHNRHGNGADDGTGHNRHGNGADDGAGHA